MTTNGISRPNASVPPQELDAIIVGAGFGGIYLLQNLRKLGYKVKGFESGAGLGGVWWWNSYPGARVDTSIPLYEYSAKELWEDWTWKEKFPSRDELCDYFRHVDQKWDLSKDIQFNSTVTAAEFDQSRDRWTVYTDKGDIVVAHFLLLATGFAAKVYVPELKGLKNFKGASHHTALWPKEGVDVHGKRVGVIGTGASGVQVIQQIGQTVEHLTVFQRTPNTAMPMGQQKLEKEDQQNRKESYPDILELAKTTFAGWDYDPIPKTMAEDTPDARMAFWELLWAKGGFYPWLGNYKDLLQNQDVNDAMYDFWREKVRARITKPDPALIENLAPQFPINPFGTKRPSLEQAYYEVYNQSNVDLINTKKTPILEVTPTGVRTVEREYPLDVLILATGFDAVTGSLTQIDIRGVNDVSLKEKWKTGSSTQLGLATAGFPNMFFLYGPQGPTAFAIGPTISEIQGDWIISLLESMKSRNQRRIDVESAAEESWTRETNEIANGTLFAKAETWYMGSNIPGKPREALNYMGGLPLYKKALQSCAGSGYAGFVLK